MAGEKILIVDDSRQVREFLAESVLRPAGYIVLEAADGRTGLNLARSERPDVIIADLQMPGLTGLEMKRALNQGGDSTPVILVTAEGSENIASQATLAGVAFYLPKPVDVDVLMAAVEQALDLERLRRERAEAVAALHKRLHQLETLQGISRALAGARELPQVLSFVVEAAVRLTAADAGGLYLLDERGSRLNLCAVRLPGDTVARAVREPADDALAVQVIRTCQPAALPAGSNGHATAAYPRLCVPLRLRDSVLGALAVDNRHAGRRFAEADLGPLVTLADHAATAIANARLIAELQHQSTTDSLSGLLNRRHFFTLAEREFNRAMRYGRSLAAVMLDIDRFKQVNDAHGHAAGDQVIAEVARRCATHIRSIDVLGRYGGEEFALILPETDAAGAGHMAERLRQLLAGTPVDTVAGPLSITVSLGVAGTHPGLRDFAELMQLADAALYQAKQVGRNRVVVHGAAESAVRPQA